MENKSLWGCFVCALTIKLAWRSACGAEPVKARQRWPGTPLILSLERRKGSDTAGQRERERVIRQGGERSSAFSV